jgi:acid stress-induced BolA-like protein IbaG/YrbA
MSLSDIQLQLQRVFVGDHVQVSGDLKHAQVCVVSEKFLGLRPVQKQQLVYSAGLGDAIASGVLHAVHLQTHTPTEWRKLQKFNS